MDNRIILEDLPLAGLKLIKRKRMSDQRGFLQRMYCSNLLTQSGFADPISQINFTLTHRSGTIRGMHFQSQPFAETKIISCLRGQIFDVAVDIRQNSPTFLQWHAEILSPESCNSLIIPKGFAHGFQTLSDACELIYFHTAPFHPASEGGLSPLDPSLNISWPEPIAEISERDKNHRLITDSFKGINT